MPEPTPHPAPSAQVVARRGDLPAVPDGPAGDPQAAHRARVAGRPWSEAAAVGGYDDEVAARLAVTSWRSRALLASDDSDRAVARALELERLDALQAAWWSRAVDGLPDIDDPQLLTLDDKAAGVVLKVIAQRARLLNLEEQQTGARVQTIVISGDSDEYVAGLQRVIEG